MEVRIMQGPLKGKRWVAGSSSHGCWLGSYEFQKQKQIAVAVRPGMVCFDIGANVGFYTLLLSKMAGNQGLVVAFEPVPKNCDLLRRQVGMNSCKNVVLQELALADFDGSANFDPTESSSQGHLAEKGLLNVRCARIDSLVAAGEIPAPEIMKIDVEGAEVGVLSGAREVIARNKPVIFLATHGEQPHRECCSMLQELGYDLVPVAGTSLEGCDEIVASPQ
jgi:FkbM family methyltransferase